MLWEIESLSTVEVLDQGRTTNRLVVAFCGRPEPVRSNNLSMRTITYN